jgi:hypothetical protein
MLEPSDQLPARLARDRDPSRSNFGETDSNFDIDWKGRSGLKTAHSFTPTESPGASL